MFSRFASILLLVLGTAGTAEAQDAASYFHEGAQLYLDGSIAEAKAVVEEGLTMAPQSAKLQALKKKLDQKRQQQNQQGKRNSQNQQQQQNDPSSQNQQQNQQNQKQQNPSDQEQQQNQQRQQSDEQQRQQEQEQQSQQPQRPQQDQQEPQRRGTPSRNPEKISEQQALRILQALENQELELLRKVQQPESQDRHVEKDW